MIGIEVNGEFLDLFPDTSINLKLVNPIFADGNVIPGSYSIPFDVPGGESSPKNARLLFNPDVVENTQANPNISARLFFDGIRYKTGKIRIGTAGSNRISINFIFGLRTISDDFKTLRLRDVVAEAINIAPVHTYTKKVLICARTTTYSRTFRINVNGKEYSGTSNAAIATAINADTDEPRARATYVNSSIHAGATDHFELENYNDPNDVFAPLQVDLPPDESFFYWFAQADEFESDYNDPIKDWLSDYHSATPIDGRFRFGLVKNASLFKNEKSEPGRGGMITFSSPFVNLADANDFLLNKPVTSTFNPRNYTTICPFVRVRHIIDKIKAIVDFEGSFEIDSDIDEAVILHSNSLDTPIHFVGTIEWLVTRTSFNVSEFVPDVTVVDFLKAFQTRFNYAVYFNERTNKIRIQSRDHILDDSEFVDITALSSPIDNVGYDQNPTGVRLLSEQDGDDELSTEDKYELGDPELEIKTEISGIAVQEANDSITFRRWLISTLTGKELESVVMDRPYDTSIPMVIGFYDYLQSLDSSQINYPAIVKDMPSGDFTFNNLAQTRWEKYLRFLMNRKSVAIMAQFEIRHLIDIDWEKKYGFDRVKYLISSIDVTLTMKGIGPSKVLLYSTGLGTLPA